MATAVVSGRVDERVKERADCYIRAAGLTQGDVIRMTWGHIARTGEVPDEREGMGERSDALGRLLRLRKEFSKSAPWLADLTKEQMRDMIASRHA